MSRNGATPLIGLTTSEIRPSRLPLSVEPADPDRPEMALGMTYVRALERFGATPVVIPPLPVQGIDGLLSRLDGLCLSGGPDIDPVAYREQAHPKLGPTWSELDAIELELARRADAAGVPVLGICRGAQTLNVARGGDLHQHLPDSGAAGVEHRQVPAGEQASHPIEIDPASRLGEIIGAPEITVNSFHHQGVKRLGERLTVSARSRDGVVEGIEDRSHPFLLGVQWHAEYHLERESEARLFGAFLDAAVGFGGERAPSKEP
jgi:putative glutamine amidotransferase